MKLLNISAEPGKYANAVQSFITEFGIVLEVAEMGKVRLGLAFNPSLARQVGERLVRLAEVVETQAIMERDAAKGGDR